IEAGDAETGVCIMQMDAGLDTGAVVSEHRYTIRDTDTANEVHDALMDLGVTAIVRDLQQLQAKSSLHATPQPETGVTYAQKLSKEEAKINWNEAAEVVARKIRAFNPVPTAWTEWQGKTMKIWAAHAVAQNGSAGTVLAADANGIVVACGSGAICITELQAAGSKRMTAAAFLAGRELAIGALFV
ncbi:methionyl-tRNA formyltransferase, partial [Kingella kingae]